jgi:hypothetical protein
MIAIRNGIIVFVRLDTWEVIVGEGSKARSRTSLGQLGHPCGVNLSSSHALSNEIVVG